MIVRLCLVGALLGGCAGPGSTATGTATAPAASAHQSPSREASEQAASESSTPLPPMPAAFPVHPSMQETEAEARYIASWTSDAVPPELYAFYLEELPGAGFVIDLEGPGGEAAIIRFHAPDGTAYQLDMVGRFTTELGLGPPHP